MPAHAILFLQAWPGSVRLGVGTNRCVFFFLFLLRLLVNFFRAALSRFGDNCVSSSWFCLPVISFPSLRICDQVHVLQSKVAANSKKLPAAFYFLLSCPRTPWTVIQNALPPWKCHPLICLSGLVSGDLGLLLFSCSLCMDSVRADAQPLQFKCLGPLSKPTSF